MIAFSYYGGKATLAPYLVSLIPPHVHYLELFGGSAAVLLSKPPSMVETYNDRYSHVVNFFRVLRTQPEQLVEALLLTPYSREEYELASEMLEGVDDLERARRFFVRVRQGFSAVPRAKNGWRVDATGKRGSSCPVTWRNSIPGLLEVADRFLDVQIENSPALEVLLRRDFDGAYFYLDPPYVLSTRGQKTAYAFEMSDAEHAELAEALHGIKGKAMVSGYRSELYDQLYADWERIDIPSRSRITGDARTECVWLNYPPPKETQILTHDGRSLSVPAMPGRRPSEQTDHPGQLALGLETHT